MTMLTPRSYLFTRPSSANSTQSEKPRKFETASSSLRRNGGFPVQQSDSRQPRNSDFAESPSRPTTPSSPVVIPSRGQRDTAQNQRSEVKTTRRQNGRKQSNRMERQAGHPMHSPDAIPPSVAALLAITNIPPHKVNTSERKRSGAGQKLTVDAMLEHTKVSEKELSVSPGRSPMDLLLTPPDELDQDELLTTSASRGSIASMRTLSSESVPSLCEESMSESLSSPSLHSFVTPSSRGRRSMPTRRFNLASPSGQLSAEDDHPLSKPGIDLDELDFRVFQRPQQSEKQSNIEIEIPRRKSAFKSNLTASLKALRSAARSFSSLTTPMITPDDFLTRSIISIDPRVPFTDERMPPRLEDTPTPALRRYLNPTTNAPIEAHVPASLAQTMSATQCTASIQMQTYKISRAAKSTSPSVISRRTQTTPEEVFADVAAGPVARQRDMRENSDFIRIAVMEMAMRRKGKLDDQKPGRARWALPPRKLATKPYQIGENGVPVRWMAVTH